MDKLERIFQLNKLLSNRRTPISRADLTAKLNCSRSTLTRLIKLSRDFLEMPIEFDYDRQGYYLNKTESDSQELPGLWFSSSEIYALLTSHRLLSEINPGILDTYISPLKNRLESLLAHKHAGSKEIFERIRILPTAPRLARVEDFQKMADALVTRHQLRIQYRSRGKDELEERWVSPQRLIYYRDNWYLDAWCHKRKAIRTFSIDRANVSEKGQAAKEVAAELLDQHFTQTYGIFAGAVSDHAQIRFSSKIAQWVADEQWHPDQQYKHLPDGGCEITIPYGNPTELIMDILKYGPEAEVISPPSLRKQVSDKLSQALRKYRKMK